jgi:hypothetical protein
MIYVDSTIFVLATSTIVHGLGINSSREVCEGGILLCESGLPSIFSLRADSIRPCLLHDHKDHHLLFPCRESSE